MQEFLRQRDHDYEELLNEFNKLNMEFVDLKQEHEILKEKKTELSEKLGLGDEASIEWNLKYDVRL